MSQETHKALSRRWFEEVWNQRREATIDELLSADTIIHGLGGPGEPAAPGPEAFRAFWKQFSGAFPDLKFTVDDVIAERDLTCIRISFHGSHRGDHLGVKASGNPIAGTGLVLARWRDGRIIESWNEFDALGVMTQAGVVRAV
jgi:predicted ester cyclase